MGVYPQAFQFGTAAAAIGLIGMFHSALSEPLVVIETIQTATTQNLEFRRNSVRLL
jgi:hypothetical protein